MKRTYQPSKVRRARTHGFLVRMKSRGGRAVMNARRAKGRKKLSQVWPTGEMIRSWPLTRTSTLCTPSGRRTSSGRRTACVRLLMNTVPMDMIYPRTAMYIGIVYSIGAPR